MGHGKWRDRHVPAVHAAARGLAEDKPVRRAAARVDGRRAVTRPVFRNEAAQGAVVPVLRQEERQLRPVVESDALEFTACTADRRPSLRSLPKPSPGSPDSFKAVPKMTQAKC